MGFQETSVLVVASFFVIGLLGRSRPFSRALAVFGIVGWSVFALYFGLRVAARNAVLPPAADTWSDDMAALWQTGRDATQATVDIYVWPLAISFLLLGVLAWLYGVNRQR